MSDRAVCSCAPGSLENGWHEIRCPECESADLQQWRDAMATLPAILARFRAERAS